MSAGAPREPLTPGPVAERPPEDRYCDLILNGGVASGVVYPWAIVELARHYRFRSIGGNSVGAMAAVLAAAAEYGRCHGHAGAFEVLRRAPVELAQEQGGRTQMLRLFQPSAGVRRVFDCFVTGIRHFNADQPNWQAWLLTIRDVLDEYRLDGWLLAGLLVLLLPALALSELAPVWAALLSFSVLGLAAVEHAAGKDARHVRASVLLALLVLLLAAHAVATYFLVWQLSAHAAAGSWWGLAAGLLSVLGVPGWLLVVLALGLARLGPELRAFKDNGYGLCTGRAQPATPGEPPREKALIEWLHEGIQRSAGRERHEPPLTFADLWNAPRAGLGAGRESISLEVFSTNLTLARPVIWPLRDRNTRLFFRKEEWARIFPPTLLQAVCDAAVPYAPGSDSDPPVSGDTEGYLEIPSGRLPIAVAARLSLSFPLLFSCVPVHAVDYEEPLNRRVLRKCQLTDGGVCTNFPIHLFDAAHPRWPTFGLMLSRRIIDKEGRDSGPVWLPDYHADGRADNWLRGVPGAERKPPPPGPVKGLFGLLGGMLATALEWNDNLVSRLPHARNRVLRMALKPGEGQLHLTMPRATILRMAHEYGTLGGIKLVNSFVAERGEATPAWREHLYVRALNQLRSLAGHLRGYPEAVTAAGFTRPLAEILADASRRRPLRQREWRATDPLAGRLGDDQQRAVQEAVDAVAVLARALQDLERQFGPYRPVPQTKLHMRSRI